MTKSLTAAETIELRTAVQNKYLYGTYRLPEGRGCSRGYRETEMVQIVEEQVRTHMQAGHTAQDLIEAEKAIGWGRNA